MEKPKHPERTVYIALGAVCFFWGTTYLGIRIAIEDIPPLYLIASRYVISGGILVALAALRGAAFPRGRALLYTAIYGAICIGVGNGFLAIAEKYVPSGLAALFYTSSPFWMVGIDALLPGGKRPLLSTVGGLVIGLLGVAFLVVPSLLKEGLGGRTVSGFALLEISALGWVLGALLQKRVVTVAHPLVVGAVQQLAAGLAVFVPAMAFEKAPHSIGWHSGLAVGYLVIFGSLIGFSSFIYSMAKLPVAIVSIYTFVNPIVAVLLGSLLYGEAFGARELIAMLIIFAGVALVRWSESERGRNPENLPELPVTEVS